MITAFHILQAAGLTFGAVIGYRWGAAVFGVPGGVIGSIAGLALGWVAGRLPLVLSLWHIRRSLSRKTLAQLRNQLQREYFISHLIIEELIRRGEPMESFRKSVLDQLSSPSKDIRRFGRGNALLWFPDLVDPRKGEGPSPS